MKALTFEQRKAQAALIGRRVVGSHTTELRIDGEVLAPAQRDRVPVEENGKPARVIVLPSLDDARRDLDKLRRRRPR